MTPIFACGFECASSGHWTGATFATSTVRNGARSLDTHVTAGGEVAATWATMPAATRTFVLRFYVYFPSLPNVDIYIGEANTGVNYGALFKVADSKIYAARGVPGSTTNGATGISVTTATWYRIDLKVNTSANPATIDVQVDGSAAGQVTNAVAAADIASVLLGVMGGAQTATAALFFDDVLISSTAADYPLGKGYVNHFVPTSDGAHTATTTTIVKGTIAAPTGGGNVAGSTDVFNWVNAVPLLGGATDNTRLVNQQSNGTTLYAEVIFGAAPGIGVPIVAPRAVEVITADREAATTTGDFTTKINDNGTESTVIARGVVAGSTSDRYATKQFATAPTGGAWTVVSGAGNFNNLRARFGYASDANPDQYWRGIMVEAEFPEFIYLQHTPTDQPLFGKTLVSSSDTASTDRVS